MSLQWHTPRAGQWASKSADGYYAIGPRNKTLDGDPYEAFYIEALWAIPKRIGLGCELTDAQRVCDEHHERPGAA